MTASGFQAGDGVYCLTSDITADDTGIVTGETIDGDPVVAWDSGAESAVEADILHHAQGSVQDRIDALTQAQLEHHDDVRIVVTHQVQTPGGGEHEMTLCDEHGHQADDHIHLGYVGRRHVGVCDACFEEARPAD